MKISNFKFGLTLVASKDLHKQRQVSHTYDQPKQGRVF